METILDGKKLLCPGRGLLIMDLLGTRDARDSSQMKTSHLALVPSFAGAARADLADGC